MALVWEVIALNRTRKLFSQQKESAAEFTMMENRFGVTRVSVMRMVDGVSN